jgi:hypothetical protein
MPSRTLGTLWVLAVSAAVIAAAPAAAQRAADYAARIDTMAARAAALRAAMQAVTETRSREVVSASMPTDTVRSGPLRMLVSRDVRPFAQDALDRAAKEIEGKYGAVLGTIAQAEWSLSLLPSPPQHSRPGLLALGWTSPDGAFHLAGAVDSIYVTGAIAEQLYRKLRDRISPQLERWVGAVPLDTGTTAEWAALRVGLASQRLPVARRCFAGEIESCKEGFGLTAFSDSTLPDPDGTRRRAVMRHRSADNAVFPELERQCFRRVDTACVALVRAAPWLGAPLAEPEGWYGEPMTATLIREAIRVGGRGAVARLVTATGTVPEQLATISGTSIDSLMNSWHRHVRTAHHQNDTMSFEIALTSVLWAALFGVAALRSSRWR